VAHLFLPAVLAGVIGLASFEGASKENSGLGGHGQAGYKATSAMEIQPLAAPPPFTCCTASCNIAQSAQSGQPTSYLIAVVRVPCAQLGPPQRDTNTAQTSTGEDDRP
jgi:hypothetical protein